MRRLNFILSLSLLCAGMLAAEAAGANPGPGIFEANTDVGQTPKPGGVQFAAGEYRVTGGGANIWAATDAFHFAWKRVSGNIDFTADVQFAGAGTMAHRKATLMIRQGLEPGAAYADVAVHGDGLTALQFRPSAGAMTQEVRSTLKGPVRIRIERRGGQMTAYAGRPGEQLQQIGATALVLQEPVYVGLAVCSHDANILETAIFSNVQLEAKPGPPAAPQAAARPRVRSNISIYDLRTKSIQVIYTAEKPFEAPNWSPDGKYLLVNSGGALWGLALNGKTAEPERIELGGVNGCNNDHGISPDGKRLAISARGPKPASHIYVSASDGSGVRLITPKYPSYYHSWSPDGRWLAYTAQRDDNFDIYRIAADGGEEQRLTSHAAYDDGPDYSPDGKWIYFNSERSGNWDIWRIPADGAGPGDEKAEQITSDEYEDWFPHPSPDGKWMVFPSFAKGTKGHPANQEVVLRMMPLPGARLKPASIQVLTKLFGGQGTINVPSWSPDSTRFAFVSYELLPGQ